MQRQQFEEQIVKLHSDYLIQIEDIKHTLTLIMSSRWRR